MIIEVAIAVNDSKLMNENYCRAKADEFYKSCIVTMPHGVFKHFVQKSIEMEKKTKGERRIK